MTVESQWAVMTKSYKLWSFAEYIGTEFQCQRVNKWHEWSHLSWHL